MSDLRCRRFRLQRSRAGNPPSAAGRDALRRGAAWGSAILGGALDLLLPPQCLTCDAPVAAHGLFCAACFAVVTLIGDPCCVRCGLAFASTAEGGRDGTCPACRAAPPRFGQARAALRYDGAARHLILPMKHADRPELAGLLAPHLVRAGVPLLAAAELLVPVPLHRGRLFSRRYNQAALLARAVGRLAGRQVVPDALRRLRPTAPLGGKSAAARAEELAGAFAVRASRTARFAGRHVLLIDDVLTSGATANACAEVLLAAGARAVDVLAAARVPDPRQG